MRVSRESPTATDILSEEAVAFVADLNRRFRLRRTELLAARVARPAEIAAGGTLGFLSETADIRSDDWTVPAALADLTDRRVEIAGLTERKMIRLITTRRSRSSRKAIAVGSSG